MIDETSAKKELYKKDGRNSKTLIKLSKELPNLGNVWFVCFLFSFSLEIKNGDRNVFHWISIFIPLKIFFQTN